MFFCTKNTSSSPDYYSTGTSRPPAKHRWFSFVFLVSVIFISGILTGMSLLNIPLLRGKAPAQLTRAAYTKETSSNGQPVAFGEGALSTYDTLGFTGQEITGFCQLYYGLPQGIYVTAVTSSGACANLLLPGDVVVTCHGRPIPNHETFLQLLSSLPENTPFYLGIFRQNELIYLRLTPEASL